MFVPIRQRKLLLLVVAFLFLATGARSWMSFRPGFAAYEPGTAADLSTILAPMQRVLVIAPHSDDETLGSGGLIYKLVHLGATVRVVLYTNGDGFTWGVRRQNTRLRPKPAEYIRYGEIRQQESLQALATLGLPQNDVIFLSYPDRSLQALWLDNWDCANPYRSPMTGLTASPYQLTFHAGTPYCGQAVVNDLLAIFREFQPTVVVLPHPNDAHSDHWAGSNFAIYALETWKEESPRSAATKIQTLFYLVHRGKWPQPKAYAPGQVLTPPKDLQTIGTIWMRLPLTAQEKSAKYQAILQYKTQISMLRRFLLRFVRENELFGIIPEDTLLPAVAGHEIGALDQDNRRWQNVSPIISDPVKDTLKRAIDPAADIMYVKAYRDDQRLLVQMRLRGKANALTTYSIRLVTFQQAAQTADRQFNFKLKTNHQVVVFDSAGRQRHLESQVAGMVKDDTVSISIPLSVLKRPQRVFLAAETALSLLHIDWTSWRLAVLTEAR